MKMKIASIFACLIFCTDSQASENSVTGFYLGWYSTSRTALDASNVRRISKSRIWMNDRSADVFIAKLDRKLRGLPTVECVAGKSTVLVFDMKPNRTIWASRDQVNESGRCLKVDKGFMRWIDELFEKRD